MLGVRTAPQQVRYAIVQLLDDKYSLLNADAENELRLPAETRGIAAQLSWVKDEMSRILRQHADIEGIAIKVSEYGRTEDAAARMAKYLDASVLIAAAEAGIQVQIKLYSQMATKRADVKRHAEDRVARTTMGWNEQMADAVAVAWVACR